MEAIESILKNHSGRDRVIRTVSYAALYLSGITQGNISRKLKIVSSELSQCRTVLRLFDDLPMLKVSLSYGLGKEERDKLLRLLGVLTNIADQLYYPSEHISWASTKGIISVDQSFWTTLGTSLWGWSLFFGVAGCLRILVILRKEKQLLLKQCEKEIREAYHLIEHQQLFHTIALIKYIADLTNAINWLPRGFLWAGKLKTWEVGLLGMLSSVLSLILYLRNT
ncbi:peroxisomal membrane protein 11C-like [Limulus polyphemus]|uniref:Peroxisomal membrane protein 11C-like n=1 Tax=Limulus polyphemus TaxID=6850 RepID=A0ABM1BJ18_LIMPO|nr:peroxisomal membrane protein 11C-like [Limulus polyphemus]XP_022251034.1 peroxisomal membrane protein 11C-like [Limulus polyphemus]XP_022251035.1 peroxisomal membrane protein 11C-like [Limulus polyphemus]